MSHLHLDARAILHYLNELGYRNISSTQLKEFLKDLHKLIKYEERMGVNSLQNDYYESLFRRTTASYRAKIDRENKSDAAESSSSRYTAGANRKVLGERNYGETTTSSNELLSSIRSSKSQVGNKVEESRTDRRSVKALVEKTLSEVLNDKHTQEFLNNNNPNYISKENSPIRSIVEQVLKEKLLNLRHTSRDNNSLFKSSETSSLRSIIADIVLQVLQEKLSSLQKENENPKHHNDVEILNKNIHDKLTVSSDQDIILPREPVAHYNKNRPLDSQCLVQQLLNFENVNDKSSENKHLQKSKTDREISNKPTKTAGCIKRLQRSPRKKPEWQDPSLHDKILDKPVKATTSQSPAISSSARSSRGSKYSSSVLIRRSKSQGRKPNSDPVALYQYYKNEWEHFRKQIPGETSHDRLRWHVRQRFLDPE